MYLHCALISQGLHRCKMVIYSSSFSCAFILMQRIGYVSLWTLVYLTHFSFEIHMLRWWHGDKFEHMDKMKSLYIYVCLGMTHMLHLPLQSLVMDRGYIYVSGKTFICIPFWHIPHAKVCLCLILCLWLFHI